MATLNELRQKRAGLVAQAREIVEDADKAERALTQEEETRYDKLMDEVTNLKIDIDRREKLEDIERNLGESRSDPAMPHPGEDNPDEARSGPASKEYRDAFNRHLLVGRDSLRDEERRALQVDNDELGGFLTAPEQMVNNLIKAIDNEVYIRQWATKYTVTNSDSLGAPSLDADPDDADWTGEITEVSADSSMDFGKRELHPHLLSKLVKASMKLLRKVPSAEQLVTSRLAYKFGITQEKGFMTGTGDRQPLGIFTASSLGISTDRDVSDGNTTTSMTFDGLISAKYALKAAYWRSARWIMHRDGVKQVAKLKDGEGQYLWRESVRAGEPDRLLNLPLFMSEYAPNTFTTGNYVGALGDFSHYWIADAMSFAVQRLVEKYAHTNQIGFIGRLESDGMPVLEEAFVRVTLA